MNPDQLRDLIALGSETRHLEYKRSMPWTDTSTKGKITKAVLGMSNIMDGGAIILGIEKRPDGSYLPQGMQGADADSYDADEVHRYIQDYADPDADFRLDKIEVDSRLYVILEVREFRDIPIICRKNGPDNLTRGTIYTRTNLPETVSVPGETEMREIINMAVDKGTRQLLERLRGLGLLPVAAPAGPSDLEQFERELEDLGNGR